MTINDLYKVCNGNDSEVYVNLNGKMIPMSSQYYVEYEIVYLFPAIGDNDGYTAKGNDIAYQIKLEAEDECWRPDDPFDKNMYLNCDVMVLDGDDFDKAKEYEIKNIKADGNKIIIEA